jgi:hypothetical protein
MNKKTTLWLLIVYYIAVFQLCKSYLYAMYRRQQWEKKAAALVWQTNHQHALSSTQGYLQVMVCRNTKIGPFRLTDDRGEY